MSCASRCTGHCCKEVMLPLSPVNLRKGVIAKKKSEQFRIDNPNIEEKDFSFLDQNGNRRSGELKEIEYIQRVFKLIRISKTNPSNDRLDGTLLNPLYIYTCINLDKDGNCTDYENRPYICRNYPYGRQCEYKSCTLKEEDETTKIKGI